MRPHASADLFVSPAQLEAATAEAVQRSVQHFMSIVAAVRSPEGAELRDEVMLFEMKHVDMQCADRSGPYDLLHYPYKDEIYAADSKDESIVYVLGAVAATQLTEGCHIGSVNDHVLGALATTQLTQ
jgi:hypothetical protein